MKHSKLPSIFHLLPKVHNGPIYGLTFDGTGQYCMSASDDRSVGLFNPSKGILIKHYKNLHNYDVSCVKINRDNSKFVTGGGDKIIVVTDVTEGKTIRKFMGHTQRINTISLSQQDEVIISGSYDTKVMCWDNRNNSYHPIQTIRGFKDSVSQVQVIGNEIICASMDGTVKFYDVRKGELTEDVIGQPIHRMAISFSSQAYAVSCTNNSIYLAQKDTGKCIQQYDAHKIGQYAIDICFDSSDSFILSGSSDGQLYIYDIMRKQPIKTIRNFDKPLSAIDMMENGALITGSHNGNISYWKKL